MLGVQDQEPELYKSDFLVPHGKKVPGAGRLDLHPMRNLIYTAMTTPLSFLIQVRPNMHTQAHDSYTYSAEIRIARLLAPGMHADLRIRPNKCADHACRRHVSLQLE